MNDGGHPLTLSGRVDEDQFARIDAAARLTQQPRAHFVVQATLERATEVIQKAAETPELVEQTA